MLSSCGFRAGVYKKGPGGSASVAANGRGVQLPALVTYLGSERLYKQRKYHCKIRKFLFPMDSL